MWIIQNNFLEETQVGLIIETCVMDLALTNEGLKVVEFNCLNASGFYYHDVRAIVKEVNAYYERKY